MKKMICTDTGKWTRIKACNGGNGVMEAIERLIVREFDSKHFVNCEAVEYSDFSSGERVGIFRAVGGMQEHSGNTREFIIK